MIRFFVEKKIHPLIVGGVFRLREFGFDRRLVRERYVGPVLPYAFHRVVAHRSVVELHAILVAGSAEGFDAVEVVSEFVVLEFEMHLVVEVGSIGTYGVENGDGVYVRPVDLQTLSVREEDHVVLPDDGYGGSAVLRCRLLPEVLVAYVDLVVCGFGDRLGFLISDGPGGRECVSHDEKEKE